LHIVQLQLVIQKVEPLDPQNFGFLDPDPEIYADPRGKKISIKTKNVALQTKNEIINNK